jgi:hypothetical protein
MNVHVDAERPCELDTVVGTRIVDDDETISNSGWDIGDRLFEGGFCPVGGHGENDLRRGVCSAQSRVSRSGRGGDTLRR